TLAGRQFQEQQQDQRPRPQRLVRIIEEEGEPILAGWPEGESRNELLVFRQHLGGGRSEEQRRDQRVAGVGQAERRLVLHLRVGVLQRLAQRLQVVRQGSP